ncbi:MAG: tRNA (adenine-N(6)-)-methyltransferase [Nanoarchaeales archaeon]|nr:tRNA (adenine-N(6)-)-methyltransferase [Nanoarchaeales archaeon]
MIKKKLPSKKVSPDDYMTPHYALNPLLKYLKKNWIIWECASGSGNLAKFLRKKGYKVVTTEILRGGTNNDFLTCKPPKKYNCILTNPPYSLKNEFLERCYKLKKPFALLLPLTTLETETRQNLFNNFGLEIIFFNKRINFEVPYQTKSNSSYFATAWFTNKLKIGNSLNFVKLERDN